MIRLLAKKYKERGPLKKEILINVENSETRVVIIENNTVESFHLQRTEQDRYVGNIYKGKVVNVLPGIQAAFVDVGMEKNGFLHVSDIGDTASLHELMVDEEGEYIEKEFDGPSQKRNGPKQLISDFVKEGQEIIVQVLKDPIGTKGVRLTTDISLPGRFMVLVPHSNIRGLSRKIGDKEERKRIRAMIDKITIPPNMGIIIRTVGEGEMHKDFERDLRYLSALWKKVKKKIDQYPTISLIHTDLDLVLQTVRDSLTHDIDRVVVDSRRVYWDIFKFISLAFPRMKHKVELYQSKQPLFDKYGVEKEIEKIFKRKIWLKCGGYLVFDRTEALVTIDVNTGRHVSNSLENTVLETNLQACDQVARQLRLKNMGGIVIIDFIDMSSRRNQREVLMRLKEGLKRDKAKTNILPISELGLVEMTRQRIQETTADALYTDCPYCKGNGMVKSPLSISIEIQRALRRIFSAGTYMQIKVLVSPEVFAHVDAQDQESFKKIEKRYRGAIILEEDASYHIEKVKYISAKTGECIKL